MYKLARSRPLAAAFRAAKVCKQPHRDSIWGIKSDNKQQDTPTKTAALQQRRWLSIHEYLSANLLKTVRI